MVRAVTLLVILSFGMGAARGAAGEGALEKTSDGVLLRMSGRVLRIELWDQDIVRVVHAAGPEEPHHPSLMVLPEAKSDVKFAVRDKGDGWLVETARLGVLVHSDGRVEFLDLGGQVRLRERGTLLEPAFVAGESTYHVAQDFRLMPEEAIYGLGQHQSGVMNCRGNTVTLVQENREVAVPVVVSSRNWGILWDNYSKTVFQDTPERMRLWSEVGDAVDYYFFLGENLDEVIGAYRRLTGPAPMLPRWAYGYWQSKERYRSQHEIIGVVQEYRRRKVPLDVIVQDWQYWGEHGWNAIEFDRRYFPDPPAMIDSIHALHAHYLISVWPVFDSTTAVFKDFARRGLLCVKPDGEVTRLYDAYNPEARARYWGWLNRRLFSIGVDGWWLDATEPEFPGATLDEIAENAKAMGRHWLGTWARYLNAYSLMTCKGVYEHQRSTTERKRVTILTRSAYGGQQRYGAITWSGDIHASWEVLRNQIAAGLNFCLSGLPYWTMDIGAFVPDNPLGCNDEAYRELYVRWYQFGAFCPVFRSHGTGTPREVWRFGDRGSWAYEALVKADELRYRLLPYIYSLAWRVTSEGYTMMRGLVFDFPQDARARNTADEFMFGPAFLVCPVTRKMYFEHTYTGTVIPQANLRTPDGRPGLLAEFYEGTSFEKFVTRRVFPQIDFDWNSGVRPEEVRPTYFSIRFIGELRTEEPGEYTFLTTSNDGIRLWVGDHLVIDNWTGHGATIDVGRIRLEGNRWYPIRLEYFQLGANAVTKLSWIRPSEADKMRPQSVPPPQSWRVYLPAGSDWYDFWSGRRFEGGRELEVLTPIDRMPLFVRAGSIVPMGPVLQYADERPADPIELRIYPGADAEFLLYEDSGDGYDYEKGAYATLRICWYDAEGTLLIDPWQGAFPGLRRQREFRVVWVREGHGTGLEPESQPDTVVHYNGGPLRVE